MNSGLRSIRLAAALYCVATIARPQEVAPYLVKLRRNLTGNIVPFWTARCLDRAHGGYLINFGPDGKPNGKTSKMIVTQSRMVWLFARLARQGFDREQMLADAGIGYRFIADKMWDRTNGGFYWEVDATGDQHLGADKNLYGQSFALYALSEYALASGKPEPLALANRLFDLLERKAHDSRFGGYRESFSQNWTPLTSGSSYMGPVEFKLMNTHLHLLESVTAYYRVSHSDLARRRLLELMSIQSNPLLRKVLSGCTDKYRADWQPVLMPEYQRVSYGHDLENIWLLTDAAQAAGVPVYPYLDLFRALFANAYRYGWDKTAGGFYESGRFAQPADKRDKVWWVEAEASVTSLYLYRLTHEQQYWNTFAQTYDFIDRQQTDWQHGEWWPTVRDGKGFGDKADIWKAGYHNGRAMLECISVLESLSRPSNNGGSPMSLR